ncbi:MAG: 2Fe-2S iron-sulfur cluster binding domain-containing protein [Betaproteobacteria bacterium]|nr:2Fe-2S iron-sulfur cluster binding domain-containing protein [Betaproteobacteria bacterium]
MGTHRLSVWRAAQLVGVARGVLQKQVRDGELELGDGSISADDLLRLYPTAQFEESGLLERVTQIKEQAFGKRVRERLLPSQEVLAQRLFGQSQELADVRRHLQRYHRLVVALQERIGELAKTGDESLQALERFAARGLAGVLATGTANYIEVMDDMLKVIAAHVTVRPSGHEFTVEGRDTLLQAGLRAGLKFNYGCGNGTCGMCKVRVVSGEVAKIQPYDYPLSEAEKRQGYTLLCAHTAASGELSLEVLEAGGAQDIPEQEIVAQVRAVADPAPDIRLLHLQTPRTHRLRFLAGQSVSLGWAGPANEDSRATYAVASCPCDDRNLLFYIARNPRDPFAGQLFAGRIKAGGAITVRGPSGEFVLANGNRPLVFAACDLGFMPVKSLIEHALALDESPSLSLFWLATRSDGHFLEKQCRAWAQALDQFAYALSAETCAARGARQMAQAIGAGPKFADGDYYLAGPEEFVRVLNGELRGIGVPAGQIFATAIDGD